MRASWGLRSTRQQRQTTETIAASVQEIRHRFPTMGARQMVVTLRQDYNVRVPEYIMLLV